VGVSIVSKKAKKDVKGTLHGNQYHRLATVREGKKENSLRVIRLILLLLEYRKLTSLPGESRVEGPGTGSGAKDGL